MNAISAGNEQKFGMIATGWGGAGHPGILCDFQQDMVTCKMRGDGEVCSQQRTCLYPPEDPGRSIM